MTLKQLKHVMPIAKPVSVYKKESYEGKELKTYEGRPNAMDAFNLPSLIGNTRVWRNGRTEVIERE